MQNGLLSGALYGSLQRDGVPEHRQPERGSHVIQDRGTWMNRRQIHKQTLNLLFLVTNTGDGVPEYRQPDGGLHGFTRPLLSDHI